MQRDAIRRHVLTLQSTPRPAPTGFALPPKTPKRWSVKHKSALVIAVDTGILTLKDACEHYGISDEEFANWQILADRHGRDGLRATHAQVYRRRTFMELRSSPDEVEKRDSRVA